MNRAAIEELWRRGELRWKLHAGQRKVFDAMMGSTAQESLILCSRQWGKSYMSCVTALSFLLKNPKSIARIAAPTLKQAADIVNDNLNPICADAPEGLITRIKSSHRWQISNGSELRLGVLERANVDSLRGGNAKLIICEEGGFVTSDDYRYALNSVISPQLLRSQGRLIHVTTPSDEPDHYIHEHVIPRCELAGSKHKYTIYDNPQLTPAAIEAAMALCGGAESDAWKREYLCDILRSANRVCVPEFSEAEHVRPFEAPQYANWLTCTDVGGVRDKTVALLVYWNFVEARMYVLDECTFNANTDSSVITATVTDMENRYKVRPRRVADAPGQVQIDLRKLHGFEIQPPLKDDWMASLNSMRVQLQLGKIVVHPRCKQLIATLRGATFNKQRTDFARTEALGHADALAALMYSCRSVDKVTNPFPSPVVDRTTHHVPRSGPSGMFEVGATLNPYAYKQDKRRQKW